MENVKLNFLEEVEKEVIKEHRKTEETKEIIECIYKRGFFDCLKFLGVIGENNCFDVDSPVYKAIYKELGWEGLRELVSKYN